MVELAIPQRVRRDDATSTDWTQSRASSRLVRVLLDVRLVGGLLAAMWSWIAGQPTVVLVVLIGWMLAVLLLLLRWERFAEVQVAHPALHLLDLTVVTGLLAGTGLLSPVAFLLMSGGLFTGLCLGYRGAWYFTPGYLLSWLIAASANLPERLTPASEFLLLVVVPVLLVAMVFAGAAFQHAVIAAVRLEDALHEQREDAAIAEERARLARELHDSVTKSVHGIALLADAVVPVVRTAPEVAEERVGQIADAARSANRESRELLVAMRRADGTSGLTDMLRVTLRRWEAVYDRTVVDRVAPDLGRTDPAAQYELGAVVNEALENVARHTPSDTTVTVSAEVADGWLEVVVADDGPGIEPGRRREAASNGHFGLVGMNERAARTGGSFVVDSLPGQGTTARVRIPLGGRP
jgi:signal transduction histidine kinase